MIRVKNHLSLHRTGKSTHNYASFERQLLEEDACFENPSSASKTKAHNISNEYLSDVNGRLLPGSTSASVKAFEPINYDFIFEPPLVVQ